MVYFFGLILLLTLAALTAIDWKAYRLPDKLTLPLIGLGLGQALILEQNIQLHLWGAAIGYGLFVALELTYYRLRGIQGLGRGDAKLLAAGGAWCGLWALPYIILLASLSALSLILIKIIFGQIELTKGTAIKLPFGPFLSLAIFAAWLALIGLPNI